MERLYREIAARHSDWRFHFIGEASDRCEAFAWSNSSVHVFHAPGHRFNTWENVGLPFAAWRYGADVLHCTSSSAPFWTPVPFVVTVHDIIPLVFDDGWPPAAIERFRFSLTRATQRASKIIAVSKHTRDDLVRVLGVPRDRIEVVYWGAERYEGDRPANAVAQWELQGPYLLHLGGAAKRKNTQETVRGFADIARRQRSIELVVTGLDASFRAKLCTFASDLGIGDRVHLLGYVDDVTLDALYRHTRALLYLSLYEGFGLPLLEALARGVPVVAARRTSIPEVTAEAALLVDPDNRSEWTEAVMQILDDPQTSNRLRLAGPRRAAKFSWGHAAERTARTLARISRTRSEC